MYMLECYNNTKKAKNTQKQKHKKTPDMNINNIPIQKYLVELEMVVKYGWFNLANENLHLQFLQITSQNNIPKFS